MTEKQVGMPIEDVKMRLDLAYDMRTSGAEPITLHMLGAPGIGKSSVARQWTEEKAQELSLKFVDYDTLTEDQIAEVMDKRAEYFVFADLRLTGMDPVDASGVPRVMEGRRKEEKDNTGKTVVTEGKKSVRFVPLDLALLLHTGPGVLFLDEFSNENRPNMQAAAMKIVRDYKLGSISLHNQALVIAASNTPETSALASSLPKPLRSRFDFVEVSESKIESWVQYMEKTYGDRWDKAVFAYLKWKPSDFLANEKDLGADDNGSEPPADPRGWTYVALARYLAQEKIKEQKKLQSIQEDLAHGKLGRIGDSFIGFMRNQIPSFNELMDNPEIVTRFKTEQKYLMCVTIAEAVKAKPTEALKKVAKFLDFIATKEDREYIIILFTILPVNHRRALFKLVQSNPATIHVLGSVGSALM